jgi:hypothetical protein
VSGVGRRPERPSWQDNVAGPTGRTRSRYDDGTLVEITHGVEVSPNIEATIQATATVETAATVPATPISAVEFSANSFIHGGRLVPNLRARPLAHLGSKASPIDGGRRRVPLRWRRVC